MYQHFEESSESALVSDFPSNLTNQGYESSTEISNKKYLFVTDKNHQFNQKSFAYPDGEGGINLGAIQEEHQENQEHFEDYGTNFNSEQMSESVTPCDGNFQADSSSVQVQPPESMFQEPITDQIEVSSMQIQD